MTATLEEVRANLDHAIAVARKGEPVIVFEGGQPVVRIVAEPSAHVAIPEDFEEQKKAFLARLEHLRATTGTGKPGTPSEEIISEAREDRF